MYANVCLLTGLVIYTVITECRSFLEHDWYTDYQEFPKMLQPSPKDSIHDDTIKIERLLNVFGNDVQWRRIFLLTCLCVYVINLLLPLNTCQSAFLFLLVQFFLDYMMSYFAFHRFFILQELVRKNCFTMRDATIRA